MRGYCIDCTHYLKGGICGKTKKTISPLMQYDCYEGITENQQNTDTMEEIKTKKCSICGRELPLEEYHKNARIKDGLEGWTCFVLQGMPQGSGKERRQRTQEDRPAHKAEPVNEEKPADQPQTSPQVEAVKALGKVFGAEKIAGWMEVNEAYKLFVRYFE